MRKQFQYGAVGAAALACVALSAAAETGAYAVAQTGSAAGQVFDIGPDPAGLPANCPFPNNDATFHFLDGTMVQHGTTNKNGDWGGETLEGTAIFYEDTTPLYQGHVTIWTGGGNNAQSQSEGGFTLTFHGTGSLGSLDIHANFHQTSNANGNSTANVANVNVTCS